jgi:hypothetical protein
MRPSRVCAAKVLSYADYNEDGALSEDDERDSSISEGSKEEDDMDEDEDDDDDVDDDDDDGEEGNDDDEDADGNGKPSAAEGKKRRKSRTGGSRKKTTAAGGGGGGAGGGGRKKRASVKWSKEDEASLKRHAEAKGARTWEEIAELVNEETGSKFIGRQCYHKWEYIKDGPILPWTDDDADRLTEVVRRLWVGDATDRQDMGFWDKVSKEVGGHHGRDCRIKWRDMGNPLEGEVKHGPFSDEEDDAILEGVERGDSFATIGRALNRSSKMVNHRYINVLSKR